MSEHRSEELYKRFEPLDTLPGRSPLSRPEVDAWAAHFAPRSADRLIDAKNGEPGPMLRWLCVLRLVCERWQSGGASSGVVAWRTRSDPVAPPADRPGLADIEAALLRALQRRRDIAAIHEVPKDWLRFPFIVGDKTNLWPARRYAKFEESTMYPALDQALREIRQADGLPVIGLQQALEHPVLRRGEQLDHETLERFATWLECDTDPSQEDLSRLCGEPFAQGASDSPRSTQLNDLVAWLTAPEHPQSNGGGPLANIWSGDSWTGLRALATELCIQLKQRLASVSRGLRPAIVYIPLDRLPASAENRRPTRRDVLAILQASLGIAAADQVGAAASEARQIEATQRALTRQRVVLILDGVEIASPPFGALFEVLRATDWASFIRTLIQPDDAALIETGGVYRSRIVVLSNRRVADLEAWKGREPEALPQLADPVAAFGLLTNDKSFAAQRHTLRETCKKLWQSVAVRPNCDAHARPLHQLFQLTDASVRTIVAESGGMPGEVDLALAWCADRAGFPWPGREAPKPWNTVSGHERRMLVLRTWLHDAAGPAGAEPSGRWQLPGSTVALQLIALSINGLRLATLDRALRRFAQASTETALVESVEVLRTRLAAPGAAAAFAEHFTALIDRHGDATLEELPDELRWFELQADNAAFDPRAGEREAQMFDLRDEQLREWLIADLLSGSPRQERFRLLNEVLAEEALAQATAQARRLPSLATGDVLSARRFIQATLHGLLSLDIERLDPRHRAFIGVPAAGSFRGSLPADAYQRYLMLYQLVYRRCVENAPAWLLGRAFVREDVRLVILSMFMNPGWARHVLATLHKRSEGEREFGDFGAFREDNAPGFRAAFDVHLPHLHGAVGRDLLRALFQAALRSGRQNAYARLAPVVAQQLERSVGPRSASANALATDSWQVGFAKIAIDAMQGAFDLEHADVACAEQLRLLGAPLAMDALLGLGSRLEACDWDKSDFEQNTLKTLAERLSANAATQRELEHVSDILFRRGELEATRADLRSAGDDRPPLLRYADAYSIFWIADRVRANASARDRSEIDWPAVSARAMRYYVRVALQVSKLLAREPLAGQSVPHQASLERALEFWVHARQRIDVYSRHLFRLPAERIQALLLLAASARVRASIALGPAAAGREDAYAAACLEASYAYLKQARSLMTEHEYNRSVLKRFLLERIKTLGRAGRVIRAAGSGGELGASHETIARRDLEVLGRLSAKSAYWSRILARLDGDPAGVARIDGVSSILG